jgi:hypothetical protein
MTANKLVRPLTLGGPRGEAQGPEIALNRNPDKVEESIRELEPRLQSMAIRAIRLRLDEMQGINKSNDTQEE